MAISFIRTIILYFSIIFALRLMGKRQIGEMSPSELVVAILISDLAAVPMQDYGIPLLNGIIPIFTLIAFEMIISLLMLKSDRIKKLFNGKPSFLIKNGKINQDELKNVRCSIDDILEEMRLLGVFDIEDIETFILETNGKISIQLKSGANPLTRKDMSLPPENISFPVPLVMDGKPIDKSIDVNKICSEHKIKSIKEIFFLYKNSKGKQVLIKKETK